MSFVLVVDDDASHRTLICDLLDEMGYATRGAANGREALDLLEERIPLAVLLDLRMPVMSGWSVLEALRTLPRARVSPSSLRFAHRPHLFRELCERFLEDTARVHTKH